MHMLQLCRFRRCSGTLQIATYKDHMLTWFWGAFVHWDMFHYINHFDQYLFPFGWFRRPQHYLHSAMQLYIATQQGRSGHRRHVDKEATPAHRIRTVAARSSVGRSSESTLYPKPGGGRVVGEHLPLLLAVEGHPPSRLLGLGETKHCIEEEEDKHEQMMDWWRLKYIASCVRCCRSAFSIHGWPGSGW